jgi:polo-like kinase 1
MSQNPTRLSTREGEG